MISLRRFLVPIAATMLGFATPSLAQEVSSEAQRYAIRGEAAMEMAKSEADYREAVREFTRATQLVPNWADVWYNLGVAQDKAGDFDPLHIFAAAPPCCPKISPDQLRHRLKHPPILALAARLDVEPTPLGIMSAFSQKQTLGPAWLALSGPVTSGTDHIGPACLQKKHAP